MIFHKVSRTLETLLPGIFLLGFNPVTTLRYDLPVQAELVLTVYDLLGREVEQLVDGSQQPGYHQVVWNGRSAAGKEVPSGIYIARLVTPEYTKSVKMLLLK